MKVKSLVNKIADFGTDPHITVQEKGKQLGGGKPDDVARVFGDRRVESFIATACGEFLIFVSKPT